MFTDTISGLSPLPWPIVYPIRVPKPTLQKQDVETIRKVAPINPFLEIAGKWRSKEGDIAKNHDKYLAEAVYEEIKGKASSEDSS